MEHFYTIQGEGMHQGRAAYFIRLGGCDVGCVWCDVKERAAIIDVGITRVEDATRKSGYRIKGDVDYDAVAPKCSFITPVPGGVGPMTIAALMKNTFLACSQKHDEDPLD